MLTRLFVNNYRTLVAFDIKFDSMAVFCGANGAGKTSVFDAIKFIRDLATGKCFLGELGEGNSNAISQLDFTNWLTSTTQEFEIEFALDGHQLAYTIHLEQHAPYVEPRIIKEMARCDGRDLYSRDTDGVHFGGGAGFPLDWRQAALPSIQATGQRREIVLLQNAFANLLILQPNPKNFERESKQESRFPNHDLSNLTSWYRSMAQDQDWTDVLRESLQGVWPDDFKSLKLNDAGISAKWLELRFQKGNLPFHQLSDGEKMLVGLYVVHATLSVGSSDTNTVMLDEPDNYVSLQELQPWLLLISELIDDAHQALIISHNPEILESNSSRGVYLWRDNHHSPTRTGPMMIPEGMTITEALARGWVTGTGSERGN